MGDDPLVTVIMPLGGTAAQFAPEAVDSLHRQTLDSWELVIQPDEGMEPLANLIDGDEHIRVLDPEPTNEPEARNRCLEAAEGEYVAVLDSDDVTAEHRLEYEATLLDGFSDLDLVGQSASSVREIDGEGKVVREHAHHLIPFRSADQGCTIHHSSVMMRNEGWRYREKFDLCCDFDLFLRIADDKFSNIATVTEDLVTVRKTPGSMSRGNEKAVEGYGMAAMAMHRRREQGLDDGYETWGGQNG